MKTIIFQVIFTLISLLNLTGQNFKIDFNGVPLTCVTDSTSITKDTIIKLKRAIPTGVGQNPKCPKFKNMVCDNIPNYIEFVNFWPTQISLNFKQNTYFFMHSPRPTNPNINYGEEGFTVTYSYDVGKLTLNKKKKLLTLTSLKHNWTRTFEITYSKATDIITLVNKNGY